MKKNLKLKRTNISFMEHRDKFWELFRKMDIISSLATLSFDKRRSEFFTRELITLLKLIDNKILSKDMLYGSWARCIR